MVLDAVAVGACRETIRALPGGDDKSFGGSGSGSFYGLQMGRGRLGLKRGRGRGTIVGMASGGNTKEDGYFILYSDSIV